MGFLSGLFGGSRPKSNSVVVNWVEKRLKDMRNETAVTPDTVFALFMQIVSTFVSPQSKANKKLEMDVLNVDFAAHYANDSVLFEVGCHTYVLADAWLLSNRSSEREQISKGLADRFIRLFTEALEIENVADLFWYRVGKYAEMLRRGSSPYPFLCLGILRAKDNRRPDYYDLKDEPLMWSGVIEDMAIKVRTGEWLKAYIPALEQILEGVTSRMQKQRTDS